MVPYTRTRYEYDPNPTQQRRFFVCFIFGGKLRHFCLQSDAIRDHGSIPLSHGSISRNPIQIRSELDAMMQICLKNCVIFFRNRVRIRVSKMAFGNTKTWKWLARTFMFRTRFGFGSSSYRIRVYRSHALLTIFCSHVPCSCPLFVIRCLEITNALTKTLPIIKKLRDLNGFIMSVPAGKWRARKQGPGTHCT